MEIELKATKFSDLETLFDIQIDKKAGYLAAFTPKDPADKVAYFNKYKRLLQDPTVNNQTIILNNKIVGSIAKFIIEGDIEITYWLIANFGDWVLHPRHLINFLPLRPKDLYLDELHLTILVPRKYWKNVALSK